MHAVTEWFDTQCGNGEKNLFPLGHIKIAVA